MLKTVLLTLTLALALLAEAWRIPASYALTPSPNNRFLQDDNGSPFFWQADTAWLLFHRLNYTEAETYLSDRAVKGFTVVLAVGFTQIGIDSPNRNGDLPFKDEDVTRPNEHYWAYVDEIMELAWSKGIRICLVPSWGKFVHDNDNNPGVINSTTAYDFGHFIGSRYPYLPKTLVGDTNPYWQNKTAVRDDYSRGGAPPTYEVIDYSPVYDAMAYGIVDGEREAISSVLWKLLLTIHPTNQWFRDGPLALASAFFGDSSWLTLDASQSGHTDYAPNPPIPWWNSRRGWETVERMYATGGRPVIDNEPHYENRYINGKSANVVWNASDVRIGSWQAVFSGAAGVTYGANAVQQMAIPGLFASDGTGLSDYWMSDLALLGSGQMQYIQKAVLDRSISTYNDRIPAQDIIVGDAGVDDARITATRDSNGHWIMVYTPTEQPFEITTTDLRSCNVSASWYDPLSGEYSPFQFERCSERKGSQFFPPPTANGHSDWVLVLEAH
ncbi:glycoside hydrolase family 140 protein [Aspergillus foveolatus]|uniref:glycoside hydrolase family 140 protein n=1 Tax=Aspergillus foveolatus TaxID=210207 RepID=UPI003CCD538E